MVPLTLFDGTESCPPLDGPVPEWVSSSSLSESSQSSSEGFLVGLAGAVSVEQSSETVVVVDVPVFVGTGLEVVASDAGFEVGVEVADFEVVGVAVAEEVAEVNALDVTAAQIVCICSMVATRAEL